MDFLILGFVFFAVCVVSLGVTYFVSEISADEADMGIFWNGDMHLPIEGNEEEYLATRGLY